MGDYHDRSRPSEIISKPEIRWEALAKRMSQPQAEIFLTLNNLTKRGQPQGARILLQSQHRNYVNSAFVLVIQKGLRSSRPLIGCVVLTIQSLWMPHTEPDSDWRF
jgi:hypothetical protein